MTAPGDVVGQAVTPAQLAALPDGTTVEVTWSGGNGPHRYVLEQRCGVTYAQPPENPHGPLRWYNPLTFVGTEAYHTRVRPVENGDTDGR